MITRITPWSVTLGIGGRSITVDGEMYPRADFGLPDFRGASWTIIAWDDGVPLAPGDLTLVVAELRRTTALLGISVELSYGVASAGVEP